MQQIERLKMIDELLNKIPSKLTEMSDPSKKAALPRVEDIRSRLTPLTFQSPALTTGETPKPISEQVPRVQKESKTTVNKKDKIKETNRERLNQNIRHKRIQRARIPQRYQMQLRSEQRERAQLIYDKASGEYLKYRQLMRDPKYKETWSTSAANEFGRLAQGVGGRFKGTNTIFFIHKNQVPHERMKDVTYGSFSCDYKPNKAEKERTRLTAGGDRINYPEDVGTPTADMLVFKCLINSVVSTKGAKCLMVDVKDFYLNTPMKRYEYMRLKMTDIPDEIIKEYKLDQKVTTDGFIYTEIQKGMYGLPQAGIIAQELLAERLGKHGYSQSAIIPGLWKHATKPICFTLVVDDFAIKYTREQDVNHLISALKENYEITIDKTATKYIGLTIEWDYENKKVYTSMPGYLSKAFVRFKHETPRKKQNSPHPHVVPNYGAKAQYAEPEDDLPPLGAEETKFIQAVAGTLLYYGRAVDSTILPSLSSLATEQAKPTTKTKATVMQLLDYLATQEEAIITYNASDMILQVHSDAGYANEKGARSRAGGHFFLSNSNSSAPNNGAILTMSTIIKAVMSSAAEAELGALFLNAKEAVIIRQILTEMGHPQPRTPIQTDNTTAEAVVNNRVQPKRLKAMDMRIHWLKCREAQGQFRVHWRPGKTNLADYFTKHHPPAHHVNIRSEFLTRVKDLAEARSLRAKQGQT
jgi:hypothetical protein